MNIQLRDYQSAAIRVTIDWLIKNPGKHGIIEIPTGGGKSIIIAALIQEVLTRWPRANVLVLSHSKEILEQNIEKLEALLPEQNIGVYSASLGKKTIEKVTIGSVQTVVNATHKFKDTHLIIVDECHTIKENEEGSYNKIFKALGKVRVLGFTATPYRYNMFLTDDSHIFDAICYRVNIHTLLKKGYLCKIKTKKTRVEIDVSKLKVVAGDYSKKSLSQEVDRFGLTKAICNDLVQFKDRKHWLLFCVSIEHAEHVAEYLSSIGIEALAVHSKLDKETRELILRLYKSGKVKAIANVGILTTGFDFPGIDLIAMLRPTKSHVLYRQMIGRGMRIAEGKEDCLILDYAGNCSRLGPIDVEPTFNKKSERGGKGNGSSFTKVCPKCSEIVPIKVKVCPDCGYEFPEREQLLLGSSGAPILQDKKELLKKYDITGIFYSVYQKKEGIPVFKITYKTKGLERFSEWINFEANSFWLRKRAVKWWQQRSGMPVPKTAEEAFRYRETLIRPQAIVVDKTGKFPRVVKHIFKE